jgi:DUF971 family protein
MRSPVVIGWWHSADFARPARQNGDVAMSEEMPWPTELRVPKERDRLRVTFDDGSVHDLPAEYLRVLTPSAERKGHGSEVVVGGKRDVRLVAIHPVGRYAVRLQFDDGHATGLYTFAYLLELGDEKAERWQSYLDDIAAAGLDRDRPATAPASRRG